MTLRLVSFNIKHGGAGREDAIAETLRGANPDLVVLQEATRPDVVATVAERCGFSFHAARAGHSLGVMSRIPVTVAKWFRPRFSRHAFLQIELEGIRVFGVHLSAVHAAWTERRRFYELRQLLDTIRRHAPGFHALVGDFNTLAPGEVLDVPKLPRRLRALVWLSGGDIRWRTIRAVLDAGYADGFRLLHPQGDGATFPTWDPHIRLDYVFVPELDASRLERCEVVRQPDAARTASDHFPLLAELRVG